MSRRAGFIPAARFEVASETDSFREGWDASDGDGDGGSRDAVPPPRPTGVPAAVLSGERARPADFGGGSRGASHLAPTHPSSDVPRWQTHLTPMQQWELRLRGAASLRDAGNTSAPERRPRNVTNHPRLALQRQHEHARRLRAKEGMTQTLDLLERAARKRVEKKENAEATFSSFAADREYEESDVSSPASPASPSSAKAAADAKTVDETVEESATRIAPNDREREKRDSDRDPGPDPFASLFDAAFHESDDETDAKNSQRASSPASSESDRLETPFLDKLVARVTRPKGSVLAELSAVDALWDGRSVASAAKADASAYASGVAIGWPSSNSSVNREEKASRRERPQSARRFLERRALRKSSAERGASRNGVLRTPRLDSDDLERIEAFASSSASSMAYAKDVATFRDARKEASDAIAAAEALGRAYLSSGARGGATYEKKQTEKPSPESDDSEGDEKENAALSADWDRVRPTVRYVADYETDYETTAVTTSATTNDERDENPKETHPSVDPSDEDAVFGGSNRLPSDRVGDDAEPTRSSDGFSSLDRLPPFETLPLHFSVKDRPLYLKHDFKKLEPPPPPPRAVLQGSFKALGVGVNPEAFADPEGKKPSRRRREAYNLADASAAVKTKMDDLIHALRVRDETVSVDTFRRNARAMEKMQETRRTVARLHESAVERFAETGDDFSLREFDAATVKAVSACLDDVMDATRWWYGTRVRVAATTIQAGFRGMRGRKQARVRRKGLLAGLAYLRDFTKKVRFAYWRENARTLRRHAMITAMQDRKRTWSRRVRFFEAWRHRTHLSKRFHEEVKRLARNMSVKFHQAPAFAAWRVVAERRARQRIVGAALLRNAQRRCVTYAFATWSEIAAACARARVLDTAAHARAAARAAESFERTEFIAAAAWAAAAAAGDAAKRGSFVEARRFAERARTLRDEARATCAAAERYAQESGPDAGPGSRARRAYAAFAAAKESSLRADAAAAAAATASDFKRAAKLYHGRVVSRRVFTAWFSYVKWLAPLRLKAQKAAYFFKRSTTGSAFQKWKGEASRLKAQREAAAIRAYADIHRRLVAKHVRDQSPQTGALGRGVSRGDSNAQIMERRLKQLAGSVVGADRSSRPVKTKVGAKRTAAAASDGPAAAAARAEARRVAKAEEAAANKKMDVQRRAREWNSRYNV